MFGSDGRESSSRPEYLASTSAECDQKYGVKKHTGPLKLRVFKNSVQQLSPLGILVPPVVGFAAMSGSGKYRNLWEHYYSDVKGAAMCARAIDEVCMI